MTESVRELRIVFDGPPGPESGRFVECEDATGASINIGEWVDREDGFWELRIDLGVTREKHEAAIAAAGLTIVLLEPTDEMIKRGARAVCRQMGHNPDGNDADCRPDHESSDGWINWFWFKNEARVAYRVMIAAAGDDDG